ncbi:tripartite tricarboxylate transporter TctB family protein [uncultured Cohaesibacter sp.]|uniref:tripartite tricarboxylate transporter TctB family protein n=1 Tax=uncultured Cohaesibacter sp. TaxID=1002546 RepID=UPI0029C98BC4|nr:tripartite tricarboxylate transporter TctB family protein [uncultured Cohaesibacter sp.]
MTIRRKHINTLAFVFLLLLVGLVFQQIMTSFEEQGIASGGPYDNSASYPRAVAIIIAALLVVQFVKRLALPDDGQQAEGDEIIDVASLKRPAALLVIFGIYLTLLGSLGYHLTTTPMMFAIMALCGMRSFLGMALSSAALSFLFAYLFENYLNIVLPGGMFGLNIPW